MQMIDKSFITKLHAVLYFSMDLAAHSTWDGQCY